MSCNFPSQTTLQSGQSNDFISFWRVSAHLPRDSFKLFFSIIWPYCIISCRRILKGKTLSLKTPTKKVGITLFRQPEFTWGFPPKEISFHGNFNRRFCSHSPIKGKSKFNWQLDRRSWLNYDSGHHLYNKKTLRIFGNGRQ